MKRLITPPRNRCRSQPRIVKHFSDPGDTILVPFVGSGTECVAAVMEGREYLGFELNPDYVQLARQRLKNLGQQHPMPLI